MKVYYVTTRWRRLHRVEEVFDVKTAEREEDLHWLREATAPLRKKGWLE